MSHVPSPRRTWLPLSPGGLSDGQRPRAVIHTWLFHGVHLQGVVGGLSSGLTPAAASAAPPARPRAPVPPVRAAAGLSLDVLGRSELPWPRQDGG